MTALFVALLAGLAGGGPVEAAQEPRLSTRQLVGQRLVFAFPGTSPPPALVRRIRRGEAAGVILFDRNVRGRAQMRSLTRRLQRIPRPRGLRAPLLVMADQEGGLVKRLPGPPGRSAAQIGATGRAREALRAGTATGRSLRAMGVNVDLAPVADVPRRGSFLIRERRAFGRGSRKVGRFAGAFARGLRRAGVAATLKHFPGLGAARVNTDERAQRINLGRRRLRELDERAFEVAQRAGRPQLVMLSTAIYPGLAPSPAALAPALATRELRRRLGREIVSVSDDLEAGSLRRWGGPGRVAVRAARAGTDLLLFAQSFRAGAAAAQRLERAVRSNRLPLRALEASARRVLRLRRSLSR